MKRVIALSLLLAAFVCSLFSVEINITDFDVWGFGAEYHYDLGFTEYGVLDDYFFSFHTQRDIWLWHIPNMSSIGSLIFNQFTLDAVSSDIPTVTLRENDTGSDTYYNYLSDEKDAIAFFKTLLKDGFIVFDVIYQEKFYYRFYWWIPNSNDETRLEALEQLERYEKYLYQWSPLK